MTKAQFTKDEIPAESLSRLGVSMEFLERSHLLDDLLQGNLTSRLVKILQNEDNLLLTCDARLSLRRSHDKVRLVVHGIKQYPELDRPFFGYEFTPEDKETIRKTHNLGHKISISLPEREEPLDVFVSTDPVTRELIFFPSKKAPSVTRALWKRLSEDQRQTLYGGGVAHLHQMVDSQGRFFSGNIQFDAFLGDWDMNLDMIPRGRNTEEREDETQIHPVDKIEGKIYRYRFEYRKIPQFLGNIELQEKDIEILKTDGILPLKDFQGTPDEKKRPMYAFMDRAGQQILVRQDIPEESTFITEEIPEVICGAPLSEIQKQRLKSGNKIILRNMRDEEGNRFSNEIELKDGSLSFRYLT